MSASQRCLSDAYGMEPNTVSLPAGLTLSDLDRAFSVERVIGDDSNAFTIRSRETLLLARPGGPYTVSLYRRVSDRYHRRPCVTLTPTPDGHSLDVAWADDTEHLFWMMTMAAGAMFAIFTVVFAATISLLGLIFVLPAAMMLVMGQRGYHSSPSVRRKDCEDAVGAALRAAATSEP